MPLIVKVINTVLIVFAVFMGIKQGYAMLSGKTEMLDMFGRWNMGKSAVATFGGITILSSILILFPRTFLVGNFVMAATILLIIAFHLQDKNLKAVAMELPFFILSLLIIYLQHPLKKT